MTTWTVQLTCLEQRASQHDQFGTQLITNLADPLKMLAGRYEELRKSHADYAARLEKERDASYGDLRKMKGKYDASCQEVENRRKKVDNSVKAQSTYTQQQQEMHNVKNTYLIQINVSNRQKQRYYHEYVPELLDVSVAMYSYTSQAYTNHSPCKICPKHGLQSSTPSGFMQQHSKLKPSPGAPNT